MIDIDALENRIFLSFWFKAAGSSIRQIVLVDDTIYGS
jgi:hypothetical protein